MPGIENRNRLIRLIREKDPELIGHLIIRPTRPELVDLVMSIADDSIPRDAWLNLPQGLDWVMWALLEIINRPMFRVGEHEEILWCWLEEFCEDQDYRIQQAKFDIDIQNECIQVRFEHVEWKRWPTPTPNGEE